jgi:hypothetical protein
MIINLIKQKLTASSDFRSLSSDYLPRGNVLSIFFYFVLFMTLLKVALFGSQHIFNRLTNRNFPFLLSKNTNLNNYFRG